MKKSSDLSMEARGSGDRQRAKAAAMMEPGFMDMGAKVMAKKRTEPAPAQQANDAQKNMQNGSPSAMPTPFKKGGKVHDDSAQDKKLFNKMFAAAEKKEPKGMKSGGKWIAGAVKKPGALHRELGVPEGKKIPMAKIDKAANSSNPTLAKRANFAKTVAKFAQGGAVPRGKVAKFAAGGAMPVRTNAPGAAPQGMAPPSATVARQQNIPTPAGGYAPGASDMPARRAPVARVAPPVAARPAPPGVMPGRPAPVAPAPSGPVTGVPPRPVAPMPASTGAPSPVAGLASGIQGAMGQSGMKRGGAVQKFAMGGAGKSRKGVMSKSGTPVAQKREKSPAYE